MKEKVRGIYILLCFCVFTPLVLQAQTDEEKRILQEREEISKQKKGGSLLDQLDFSGSERAKRKAKLRDVSRPLNEDSKEGRVFPWRDSDTRRSETLHDSMRSNDSGPVYYDW